MTRGGRGSGRSSGLNEIIRASNEELDLDTTDFRHDRQPLVDYPEINQPYKALAPMVLTDLTYSLTYSLTQLLTHSITHLLTHSLTHSRTYSLGNCRR